MKLESTDRRVLRTQQALRDALVALILERGYEAVTVQDVLDRANVGRATFYTHFYDKDDLLLSGFAHLRAELNHQLGGLGERASLERAVLPISRVLFRHAGTYRKVYKAMVGKRSGNVFLTQLHGYVEGALRDQLQPQAAYEESADVELIVQYVTGALLSLLTWWLDANCPTTAEHMEACFTTMTMPAITAALHPRETR